MRGSEASFNQKAQSVLSKSQQELWVGLLGCTGHVQHGRRAPVKTRDDQTEQAGYCAAEALIATSVFRHFGA